MHTGLLRMTQAAMVTSCALVAFLASSAAWAQITVYEHDRFEGRSFTTSSAVPDLRQRGFNDRASSAVVAGPQAWEICGDIDYGGGCRLLRPGQYASLSAMGVNDRVSSLRAVGRFTSADDPRFAPPPEVTADYRRRRGERLFEARVDSARAVYGAPEQRCWIEQAPTSEGRSDARVPGALLGAVIGGILGHQVGGGTGRDLATIGGAVAGGVVGGRVGQGREGPNGTRDVQRCAESPRPATPAYWDVSYEFRGIRHRVQLANPPGPTIQVNRHGEPRAS
jgi:uncharacterized protein YcfJ